MRARIRGSFAEPLRSRIRKPGQKRVRHPVGKIRKRPQVAVEERSAVFGSAEADAVGDGDRSGSARTAREAIHGDS